MSRPCPYLGRDSVRGGNVDIPMVAIIFLAGMLAGVWAMLAVDAYNERMEDADDL